MRKILKKIPGYSIAVRIRNNRRDKVALKEVRRKIKENSLLDGLPEDEKQNWKRRIETVLRSADNDKIECVPEAGKLIGDYFIMHNGLKIKPLSYYGYPVLEMLIRNKGIHEPQEEYVFQEVLKNMKESNGVIQPN